MKKIIGFFKKYWITICIYIAMLLGYKVIADNKLFNAFLFPPLESIGKSLVGDKETMLLNMLYTFQLLIPSVIVAALVALILGTILGMSKKIREVLFPVIYSISVIPSILMSPFALLLAPDFRSASMFLVVYNTIWATMFATINGIMTIDKRYLDNAATLELSGFKKMVKVIMPAAMPSIMSGFVTALRGSFVVLVYAEMYGAKYGLGFYVKKYTEYGLYDRAWGGFVVMVIILVIVMQIFEKVKNRMLNWTID